jgi:hypothetical protein
MTTPTTKPSTAPSTISKPTEHDAAPFAGSNMLEALPMAPQIPNRVPRQDSPLRDTPLGSSPEIGVSQAQALGVAQSLSRHRLKSYPEYRPHEMLQIASSVRQVPDLPLRLRRACPDGIHQFRILVLSSRHRTEPNLKVPWRMRFLLQPCDHMHPCWIASLSSLE